MKKKSRKELAREIIASLRQGLGRNPEDRKKHTPVSDGNPFGQMPTIPGLTRTGQLQTSHS